MQIDFLVSRATLRLLSGHYDKYYERFCDGILDSSFGLWLPINETSTYSDLPSMQLFIPLSIPVYTSSARMEVTSHVDDYHASFRDVLWLQSFPLNEQTVLHYFALSPFYDRSCNNEKLKMQRLELDQLKNMRGLEYEVVPNVAKQIPQQIYNIRKQRREGKAQVKSLAMYYVLEGTVYQAPNMHAMLTSRLRTCSYRVNKAFQLLAGGVRFTPTQGYAWDFSTETNKSPHIPSELLHLKLKQQFEKHERHKEQSARIEGIIVQLMRKYVPEIIDSDLEKSNTEGSDSALKRLNV